MAHLFKKLSLMEFRQVLKSLSKRPSLVLESHQHNNCFFHILWNRFRKFQRSRSISTQKGGGQYCQSFYWILGAQITARESLLKLL